MFARSTLAVAAAALALTTGACKNKLVGISPSISVTPDSLAFANGSVGVKQQIQVSVSNSGSSPLDVTAIKVSSDPHHELAVWELLATDCNDQARTGGMSVAPGECARFYVTWLPAAAHPAAGAVEIDSNDPQNGVITLPVTGGTAVAPALQYCVLTSTGTVDPNTCSNLTATPPVEPGINFGTGAIGVASKLTVRVLNQGQAPLSFLPAPALTAATSSEFALTGSITGGTLAPGATADLTIACTPTATGTLTGALALDSNDPTAPQLQVPITLTIAPAPEIQVSPTSLAFGSSPIGTPQQITVSVTDIGVAPLLVTAVRVASDPNNELKVMSILTTDCSGNARTGGSTLQPNECAHFIVAWTPAGNHQAAGAIEVDSNDPVTPAVTLPVTGNAVSPQISVTPTTLAFGSTSIGVPQQIQVSVSNVGTAPLIIGAVKIATDPNNELSLDDVLTTDCMNQSRTGGTTLQPGDCARFTTVWSPTAVHAAAGSVEIDSNDPATPAVTLPVTGTAVTPLLQVCVLSSTGAVVPAQCSNLGATPHVIPTVAFGTVPPDTNAALQVQLTNQGTAPLTFSPAPALGTGSAAAFSLSGSVGGNSLAPGASATLTVGADASAAGSVAGTLAIASNDLRAPTLAVPITMTVPGWQLCTTSGPVAFGAVAIGSTSSKQATFTNCGQAALTVDSFTTAAISPTSSQFTYSGLPANGASIAVGGVITVSVTYKPTAVQNDAATINYSAGYGGATLTGSVSVTGNGTLAGCGSAGRPDPVPSIAASYSTNAGNTYTAFNPASTSVLPLDYIKLDASGSTVSQGTPSYTWTLTSQPTAGTQATLSSTTATTVTFEPLVSGTYSVSLVVKDSTGCVSTSAAVVNITVKAVGAIHIELTWAEDCGDLDLHYVAPGGSICDGNDIFYADLPVQYDGPGFPDWGCSSSGNCHGSPSNPGGPYADGTASDDGSLDIDNVTGLGPENVTQNAPFNSPSGTPYQVWVYYFDNHDNDPSPTGGCGSTHPTVRIFVDGVLKETYVYSDSTLGYTFEMSYMWHVANIAVASTSNITISQPSVATQLYTDQNSDLCLCEYPGDQGYPDCDY